MHRACTRVQATHTSYPHLNKEGDGMGRAQVRSPYSGPGTLAGDLARILEVTLAFVRLGLWDKFGPTFLLMLAGFGYSIAALFLWLLGFRVARFLWGYTGEYEGL